MTDIDHVARLRAQLDGRERVHHALGESHPLMLLVDEPDLRAVLDELEGQRADVERAAQKEAELRMELAQAQRRLEREPTEADLESAFRQGWRNCAVHARREADSLADEMARDFTETERARRRRRFPDSAPQQPERASGCGPQCSEMHTYEPGQCEAAVLGAEDDDCPKCKAKRSC